MLVLVRRKGLGVEAGNSDKVLRATIQMSRGNMDVYVKLPLPRFERALQVLLPALSLQAHGVLAEQCAKAVVS